MNPARFRDCQDFVNGRLHDFPGVGASRDLAILRVTERRHRIQSAVPDQLGPELAFDVVRNAARNVSTRKKCCNALGFFVFWANHQVAAANVFDSARFGHRSGDVNDAGKRVNFGGSANLFHVVYAILHTQDECALRKQWRDGARRRGIVGGLHAEQNELRVAHRANFRGSLDADFFLKLQGIEEQPVFLDRINKGRAADHGYRRTRSGQQTSKISADGAGTDDGNSGPRLRFAHGVITLMSRSMSRSVLYRCGETRMLPSRRLTITFSLRRRWYNSVVFSRLRAEKHP